MTDAELNRELRKAIDGHKSRTPDYCNDPAWCVQMMEKHKLRLAWERHNETKEWMWWAEHGDPLPLRSLKWATHR